MYSHSFKYTTVFAKSMWSRDDYTHMCPILKPWTLIWSVFPSILLGRPSSRFWSMAVDFAHSEPQPGLYLLY